MSVYPRHSPLPLLKKAQARRKPSSGLSITPIRDCRMEILRQYGFLDKRVGRAIAMMSSAWNHSLRP
jgi:hypothetical protein